MMHKTWQDIMQDYLQQGECLSFKEDRENKSVLQQPPTDRLSEENLFVPWSSVMEQLTHRPTLRRATSSTLN